MNGIASRGRWIAVVLFAITGCNALYENCDYYQNMEVGKTYYIYSPGYPKLYPSGMSCRFYAVSPPNTRIDLKCDDIAIPPSSECYYDRLTVSKSGDLQMNDNINYCGKGSIKVESDANKMNIVAISSSSSPGGTFLCTIMAKQIPNICECGWKNQQHRVVGGMETGINEFPMMAGLIDFIGRELYCAATIISQKYAVTAAHCLTTRKYREIGLLVGDHDISTGNDTTSAKIYKLTKVIIHPKYNQVTHVNDIGLVQVEGKIQFSRRIGSVCLPFLNVGQKFVGEEVIALGWGATRFSGSSSNKLLMVHLDVVSNEKCRASYSDKLTDNQICTYRDRKDSCQNDSGGPILWLDPVSGRVKLLGIISYGIQCATNHPSVNTRLTSYVDWIRSRTGEDYCMV